MPDFVALRRLTALPLLVFGPVGSPWLEVRGSTGDLKKVNGTGGREFRSSFGFGLRGDSRMLLYEVHVAGSMAFLDDTYRRAVFRAGLFTTERESLI